MGNKNFIEKFIESNYGSWWFNILVTLIYVTEVSVIVDSILEYHYFSNNYFFVLSFLLFNLQTSYYLKQFLVLKQEEGHIISKYNHDRAYYSVAYTFYNTLKGISNSNGELKESKQSFLNKELIALLILVLINIIL